MSEKKLIVIDGYSFLFRAYHSMPALSRPSDDTPVGAVYGFTSMVMKVLSEMNPTHIVIVFDAGKKTLRHKIYPEYKANRPPPPDDLIPQFALVREAAQALNIDVLEREGYEADDIIATLAEISKVKKEEVLIVSSDKDLMQLVNGHVKMYDAIRSRLIGSKEVEEKYGVVPEKIRDLLALVGDTSDNIPGVPGIGPKTAAELLNRFGDLDSVFENLSEIKQPKRRESLENSRDIVKLSRELVSLHKDMDLGIDFELLKSKPIESKSLLDFLDGQGFRTLISRAKKMFGVDDSISQSNKELLFDSSAVRILSSIEDVKKLYPLALYQGEIGIYFQPNFINRDKVRSSEDIHSVSFNIGKFSYYALIRSKKSSQTSLLDHVDSKEKIFFDEFIESLKNILEDSSITKIVWDYKLAQHLISESISNISPRSFEDIMLMAYDLGSGRSNTDFYKLIDFFLEEQDEIVVSGITKSRENLEKLDKRELGIYVSKKAYLVSKSYEEIKERMLEAGAYSFYKRVDLPLSKVVYEMERNGFMVKKEILLQLEESLEKEIKSISKEIYKLAGTEFNISSSQQMADVLFNQMGIDPHKKSKKSGVYSTSAETLEQLQQEGHTIADLLIRWRRLSKVKSTYTAALVNHIEDSDSGERIHSNFSLALTSTGRFSSTEPNLQNIPVRGDFADEIRSAFVARQGYKILALDYSQVELRIVAAIANVLSLKEAFRKDLDIHSVTAGEIFGVKTEDVDKSLRNKAKAINFGIIYGISGFGLAKNIGISRTEASEYINKYFERYPEILSFMEDSKSFARKHGYVETIMKRRCYINGINAKDPNTRSFSERAAINFPIQGSSSDIMRKSMVDVSNVLEKSKWECKMILQVHDELLFEVKDSEVEEVAQVLQNTMESSAELSVPLIVNVSIGDNWRKV